MPYYYSVATKQRMAQSFMLHKNVQRVSHLFGASEATIRRAVVSYTMYRFNHRKMTRRKLNNMEVRFIRRAEGVISLMDISRAIRCSHSSVWRLLKGQTYKEV